MLIPLTQGKFALADDKDFDRVNQFKWYVEKQHTGQRDRWYATRHLNKKRKVSMARFIMNCPMGLQVDHINGETLNNKKSNLRICTQAQNVRNSKKKCIETATSKFKGVVWNKNAKHFRVMIVYQGKSIHLGYFKDEAVAAKKYNEFAQKYFGEFAYLNKI